MEPDENLKDPLLNDEEKNCRKGMHLSEQDAQELESKILQNENDYLTRVQLLAYYMKRRFGWTEDRRQSHKHALWIIKNKPTYHTIIGPSVKLFKRDEEEIYNEAKEIWLEHVKNRPADTRILRNAAHFFYLDDKKIAEDFLSRGKDLESQNPTWPKELAHFYKISGPNGDKAIARKSYELLQEALSKDSPQNRFYYLHQLAKSAFDAEDYEAALKYAKEAIECACHLKNDWNYGNAIHHSNMVLGRLALRSKEMDAAKQFLLESANIPKGSPQLNSFGPNMTLAKELLEKGESDVVLKYFVLCEVFWGRHKSRLDEWKSIVQRGGIPDFKGNLNY